MSRPDIDKDPAAETARRSEAHRIAIDHAIDTGRCLLAEMRRQTVSHDGGGLAEMDALRADLRVLEEYAARRWVRA